MNNELQAMNHQNDIASLTEDIFNGRYYCINKRLLQLIGQWPYQYDRERMIKFWFIVFLSLSGLGPQAWSLVGTWGQLDAFVSCLTPLVANLGCLVTLINSTCHIEQMRKILDQTVKNWECMRDMPHIKILQEHGETGRTFTIVYSTLYYLAIVGWILTPLLPKLLDAVAPLNHSRTRLEMIPTDYGIDSDKFFWPIFFHLAAGTIIVLTILVAIDTFYMIVAQHVCGMFEILRNDLENTLRDDEANTDVVLQPEYRADAVYHHIVSCIKRHRILMQYVKSIQSTCEWMLLGTVWASVLVLSFTGYQTVAKSTPREEVLRMALASFCQTFHLYCITLPGHWISEESSFFPTSVVFWHFSGERQYDKIRSNLEINRKVVQRHAPTPTKTRYSCKWYIMSMRSRKLIIVLIRASLEPCAITAGKIYVMSVRNFCSVLQTAVSYLTILISLQ